MENRYRRNRVVSKLSSESPDVKPLTCQSAEFPQFSEAVCTCYLNDAGFPPGYAQWYTADGNKTGTLNVTDGSATFRQILVGPNYVELTAPNPYNVCPDSAGLTIDCSVKKIMVDSAGTYSLYCKAENKVFPLIFFERTMTINALEPPSTAPLLYTSKHPPNSGKFSVQVNIGDTLDVTCVVDGGQPAVTSVTMTCFSNTTTVAGNSLTMRIAIDVITIRFSCTCQAVHVTNCYYLKSQIFFTDGSGTTTIKSLTLSPPLTVTQVSTITGHSTTATNTGVGVSANTGVGVSSTTTWSVSGTVMYAFPMEQVATVSTIIQPHSLQLSLDIRNPSYFYYEPRDASNGL
ncbi:uncharacterized protein LOC131939588 [Physella acuta]|uniref:uncharacterized protein LOC131939588 n=1 Tax=Physella acuta TaxID=109671 RepID=UPI0027DE4D3F|nr:uncharacterized protein LOC131939588 [Physella acuta]